jgi:hypothetical protein
MSPEEQGSKMEWLLDPSLPGVRYLALRDLVGLDADDPELAAAEDEAYDRGPIAAILGAMHPDGYWSRPGPGYNPKYYSAVWSLTTLAQLGASAGRNGRIDRACSYLLDHALTPLGQFSVNGTPSGTIDCLQGNLCAALLALGVDDPRIDQAVDWMARTVTGEGIAPLSDREAALRYYPYKCGPMFACGANGQKPCAWGAVKVMLAFAGLPAAHRTPCVKRAIRAGLEFLLGSDPARAEYPTCNRAKPSPNWWKFGFPVYYVTDILQLLEALLGLGYRRDPRLEGALELVRGKQDATGRWALDYDYAGKIWVDFGSKRAPSPWVTLRALRVLKQAELEDGNGPSPKLNRSGK